MKHYLEDYETLPYDDGIDSIQPDHGTVVDMDGTPVAVYRDEDGEIHERSAICTHMECLVHWNDGEPSWDRPCHGSPFDYDGAILNGPANSPLSAYDEAE